MMTWFSPFSRPGRWLKGNLHTHTTQSDGALSPQDAIAWYRNHGYDFLAITDHWVYTPGSDEEVNDEFVLIAGAELDGPGYHMLCLGLKELPPFELGAYPAELARAVREQGGLPYFAHPYWTGQTSSDIAKVDQVMGIEVFNSVCEQMVGLGYSRVHWDELLSSGRRLMALAVDDVHWKHGAEGQGFVMVRTEQPSQAGILQALAQGDYYSSTGPAILDLALVTMEDGLPGLKVRSSPCAAIVYHARGSTGRRFVPEAGRYIDTAVLPLKEEQVYLRVECQDTTGRVAWTNPVYVSDLIGQFAANSP